MAIVDRDSRAAPVMSSGLHVLTSLPPEDTRSKRLPVRQAGRWMTKEHSAGKLTPHQDCCRRSSSAACAHARFPGEGGDRCFAIFPCPVRFQCSASMMPPPTSVPTPIPAGACTHLSCIATRMRNLKPCKPQHLSDSSRNYDICAARRNSVHRTCVIPLVETGRREKPDDDRRCGPRANTCG